MSVTQVPRRATLIYDGNCGFCRRWVQRVHRWDRRGALTFVAYQTADLEDRFPVSRAECARAMHLVDYRGTVYRGAAAGREVLRRLPAGWLWVLPFALPGAVPIAERTYRWITYRWGPLRRQVAPTGTHGPAGGRSEGACVSRPGDC